MSETFDLSLFWDYRLVLWRGLEINALVFVLSVAVGFGLGLVACLVRLAPWRSLSRAGAVYVEICRATPEYVALIWFHNVAPFLVGWAIGVRVTFNPVLSATLALGIVASGYFAESFRAGIQSVPRGHVEAARALGMGTAVTFVRIVLPQAFRAMAPELMSQCIGLLKTSTLVSVIAVPDIMYQVQMVSQQEMKAMPLYTGAAISFFALIFVLSALVERASRGARREA